MIRTYSYKLYNNNHYQKKFDRWVGVCRLTFNTAKELKDYVYKTTGKGISKYDMMKQLPEFKKDFEWIQEVNSQTLQSVIERLYDAYDKFFKGGGYPKWASRKRYKSFKFKQNVKRTDKGFKLPKFGEVKVFNNERTFEGEIKCADLIRKADGLYINVVVEQEDTKKADSQGRVGIDIGISYFCVTSDGVYIDNPKYLEKQLKKLRVEQRSLSRKKKGSKRREKQVKKVLRLHKKVTDARKDFLHKISTQLARGYKDIAIEDLKISKMVRDKDFSKHILDCGWGTFFGMLEYKSNVTRVNPKNTSRECSKCGYVDKNNRKTQSSFKCLSCGHEENADHNAAKVIEGRTFPSSRQRGAVARA